MVNRRNKMSFGVSIRKAVNNAANKAGVSIAGKISSTSQSSSKSFFSGLVGRVMNHINKVAESNPLFGKIVSRGSFSGVKSNKKPLG